MFGKEILRSPMISAILPAVNNAQVTVDVTLDRISEAFDSLEDQRKRCLCGVGTVSAFPSWGNAPSFDLWGSTQRIMIALKPQITLWVDDEHRPMMGYVEGLEAEFRKPSTQVIVNLALTPAHSEELFRLADAAVGRPNTRAFISMSWRFLESYKSASGNGGGAPLWYPRSVSFFRETLDRTS